MEEGTSFALPSRGAACCLERKAWDSWQLVSGHDEVGSSQGQRVRHRQLLQSTAEPFTGLVSEPIQLSALYSAHFAALAMHQHRSPCAVRQLFMHIIGPTRLSERSARNNEPPWTGALLALPDAWCVLPSAPGCARAPQGTPAFLPADWNISSSAWFSICHWCLTDPAEAVTMSTPTSSIPISSLPISKAIICFRALP